MEKQDSLTKFYINDKCLYTKVSWKPNEGDLFNLTLYDGDSVWSGRFSYAFADKYRRHIEETKEQYFDNVKKALFKKDQGFSYGFALQPGDNESATFTWRKKHMNSHTVLIHGSIPLHREKEGSKEFIIDFLLAENQDLLCAVDAANSRNVKLLADLNKCKCDFDKFVAIKTSLETSIFSKFLQLLNAKERRIQLLNNIYEAPECRTINEEEEVD